MKIIIAGGSGFIGKALQKNFLLKGYDVTVIGRNKAVNWKDDLSMLKVINGADVLINLAGKSIQCRFTKENKKALIASRIQTTEKLHEIVALCDNPPALWINASGGSIYSHTPTYAMTEAHHKIGTNFLAILAKKWEEVFFKGSLSQTRRVALRLSLVLGNTGGSFPVFKKLTKLFQGGKQGSGKQKVSWIHIKDLCRVVEFIIERQKIVGVVNCAAPEVVSNSNFMKANRDAAKVSFGLPAFTWMIHVGARIVGVDSSLILGGMWMSPQKLLDNGFTFVFSGLQSALRKLYS